MRIYEINTRVHTKKFDEISDEELRSLRGMGFDAIWLMGVWQISRGVLRISKLVSEDFEGSPYAVAEYKLSKQLGGKEQFRALVGRAHRAGLLVFVDFVSNHMSLDSPWIDKHPEFFITSNTRVRKQLISEYFLHASGEVVAFGKDPYFPPWHDTSQLDYSNPSLRVRMIDVLKQISRLADGVRCDMAMLVLRDYIRHQWYPLADQGWFDRRMPGEFWEQAIAEVKKSRSTFLFLAEVYWDKEDELLRLGFDMTYEKKLYDGLVSRNAEQVKQRISRPIKSLSRSVFFLENHDEQRAATVFKKPNNIAATALILSLPGSTLIHEGQLEGAKEKLPVQVVKPSMPVAPDEDLKASYEELLRLTRSPDHVFEGGELIVFDTGAFGVVSFVRRHERTVMYVGQIGDAWREFNTAALDLTDICKKLGLGLGVRFTNLLSNAAHVVQPKEGRVVLQPKDVGVDDSAAFCLLELESAELEFEEEGGVWAVS
ncbi:MAG TPA: alpha-amylase family glycosyl hydrolase [Blastocatellia bacterium]|nr:alpha-amylase family glycosyl hydrolase [Blastocatellia bacterium]